MNICIQNVVIYARCQAIVDLHQSLECTGIKCAMGSSSITSIYVKLFTTSFSFKIQWHVFIAWARNGVNCVKFDQNW